MSEAQAEIKAEGIMEEIVVSTELKNIIEALIFASDEPMTVRFLRAITDDVNKELPPAEHLIVNAEIIRKAVADLNRGYGKMGSGFRIIEIAGGFTYATQEQFSSWVGKLAKEKARRRLSPTAVETLAIIAYKQPIAKGEVEFIRGVNVDYIINALLEKDLIHITGRANTPGRPLLYGTTQKFLEHFGLNDLTDLPKPREISELINETELEVDRRLLAEQQELEFKEDLEKKLDGNEGSKNKPQRGPKIKVPDEVKEENRRKEKQEAETEQTPISVENKNIEEGERSSESNLVTDEMTGVIEVDQPNEAALHENEAVFPVIVEQDHLETNVSEGQYQNSVHPGEPLVSSPTDLTNLSEPEVQEVHLSVSEPENQTIDEQVPLTTDVPESRMTDLENPENRAIDLEHPVVQQTESEPTISTEDAEGHLAVSTESELRGRELQEGTIPGGQQPDQPSQTGWSKWKSKVKTFFQKLFA